MNIVLKHMNKWRTGEVPHKNVDKHICQHAGKAVNDRASQAAQHGRVREGWISCQNTESPSCTQKLLSMTNKKFSHLQLSI